MHRLTKRKLDPDEAARIADKIRREGCWGVVVETDDGTQAWYAWTMGESVAETIVKSAGGCCPPAGGK